MLNEPKIDDLVQIFNQEFFEKENTILIVGAEEPFFKAAVNNQPAVIYSREDYFSSALHEIAHWCIAGKERRSSDDFGYWYEPEGRNRQQQTLFEQVEVKPQAIEWLFSLACNHQFNLSADNLSQSMDASETFKDAVSIQANEFLANGLPERAHQLFNRLKQEFRNGQQVTLEYV